MRFSQTTVRVSSAIAGVAAIAFVIAAGSPATPEEAEARKQARTEQTQKYQQEREAKEVAKAAAKEQARMDELRESLDYDRRIYARLCSGWGKNFAIHEMGGVQKYKDESLSFLAGARTAKGKNELLTDAECDAAFESGAREGVEVVRNGDAKMRLW